MKWQDFRPSIKQALWDSWYQAKGLRRVDVIGYCLRGFPKCYICGRQKDFIFNFVKLFLFFDMSLDNKLVYICDDHGRITDYDCTTGESLLLPLPKPYWYRQVRDTYYWLILRVAIITRFAWFSSYNIFMWYIAIYPYIWYRNYKTKR